MITPSFGLTATERVLPRLALDWTTGLAQTGVDVTRSGVATYIDSNGALQNASVNTQRIDYSTGTAGLLVEESRTNSLRNNTMQGAVVGTPGTAPTNWANFAGTLAGLNFNIADIGNENGVDYVDIAVSGTASATFNRAYFDSTAAIAASSGQIWSGSCYAKLISGTPGSFSLEVREWASGVAGTTHAAAIVPTSSSLVTQRTKVTSAALGATTTTVTLGIRFGFSNGVSYNFTVRIGMPQLELGAFVTSVIPTESTAVTRNADVATMTGTNFSDWYNVTQGTIVVEVKPNVVPSISPPNILTVGDGTSNNRQMHYFGSDGIPLYRVAKAGVASNILFGSYTSSTNILRTAYSYSDTTLQTALNGGSITSSTQDPPAVVNRMYIGGAFVGQVASSNNIRKILYYPQQLTSAELSAFSKQG